MNGLQLLAIILLLGFCKDPQVQTGNLPAERSFGLRVGAEQTAVYFPWLKGKAIACVVNQTSMTGKVHLVDSLIGAGFHVATIFAPEHGFRGMEDAGEEIRDKVDQKTGIPIVSLYGAKKKPSAEDLEGIGIVVYDIQDVGARFYTYISTMTYVMEACAELAIPIMVLDRPNPNGDYVDGPVLEKGFESFVGLHPVPVVYGMTIGEYARMVSEEGWLANGVRASLTVVPMEGYDHHTRYSLPVSPSPNLPNDEAICLYPSLCLFEGTIVSVGRGTDYPFQVIGHPKYIIGSYIFKPESRPGATDPPYKGKNCTGTNLTGFAREVCLKERQIHLSWLIYQYAFYRDHVKDQPPFFNAYFDKLAGNATLRQQITDGMDEGQIRESWQAGLNEFKTIREKYLLYPE